MPRKIALIGLQTGDEGKGKEATHLARRASEDAFEEFPFETTVAPVLVFRYQGGGNAGHTVFSNGTKYKFHQVPSGIIVPRTFNLIGEGCFFNPLNGMNEIRRLQEQGVEISPNNLGIASNTHVTLAYHTDEDSKDFKKAEHTSTGNGIKQTAIDKVGRVGMRFQEFLDRDSFLKILRTRFPNGLPRKFEGFEAFADHYDEAREFLAPFSVLQTEILKREGDEFQIAEGAQGFRLDVDQGYYPGVTSSNPTRLPFKTDTTLGVVKLYESSVGHDRPFVGQIQDRELESKLREKFGEVGTTTGLPRDLGWFDAVAVRYAVESTGTDYLIGSCGDRLEHLANLDENIRIVTAYEVNGKKYDRWDPSFHNRFRLAEARPVLEEFAPWETFQTDGKIHPNAQRYIDRIQQLTGKEFTILGTGPGEEDVITLNNPLYT